MADRRSPSHRQAAALLALGASLMGLDALHPPLFAAARESTVTVSHPARRGAERISDRLALALTGVVEYPDLAAENERLRDQLATLDGATARQVDAERELRRLLEGSEIDYAGDLPTVSARVISNRTTPAGHLLEIDKGSAAGIVDGMPVVTGRGLVGTATLVSSRRSVISPITETGSAVGVRLADGIGVVEARGSEEPLSLAVEPALAGRVEGGDRLVTSGMNRSLFPGSIPVGEVGDDRSSVVPFVAIDDLSYVSVLLWRPER